MNYVKSVEEAANLLKHGFTGDKDNETDLINHFGLYIKFSHALTKYVKSELGDEHEKLITSGYLLDSTGENFNVSNFTMGEYLKKTDFNSELTNEQRFLDYKEFLKFYFKDTSISNETVFASVNYAILIIDKIITAIYKIPSQPVE